MKKYFVTGIIILAPLFVTFVIFLFLFNLLTEPFAGAITAIFERYQIFERGFLFFSAAQVQIIVSQILVLVFLFFLTVLLGVFTRYFFLNSLIRFWDWVIHKIPFVSSVYKATKEIVSTILHPDTNSFKQVVLVPFPNASTYSIGLVTRETITRLGNKEIGDRVAVFVPTTPNPTSGFLVMFPKSSLLYLDMKVEDAFKYVISCGVILSEYEVVSKEKPL